MRSARLVGRHRAHDLAAEQVGTQRPASARGPRGGDHDDVVDADQAGRGQRSEPDDRGSRVAAGSRDLGCVTDEGPDSRQFRQPGHPSARMVAVVVPCPGGRVGEPEVRAEVHDRRVAVDLGGHRRGLPGGEREEDEVGAGALDRAVRLEDQVREARMTGQVRVHVADRFARAAVRGRRDQIKVWVPGDQPQQFAPGIPARAGHRDTHRYRPFDPSAEPARVRRRAPVYIRDAARAPAAPRPCRSGRSHYYASG